MSPVDPMIDAHEMLVKRSRHVGGIFLYHDLLLLLMYTMLSTVHQRFYSDINIQRSHKPELL